MNFPSFRILLLVAGVVALLGIGAALRWPEPPARRPFPNSIEKETSPPPQRSGIGVVRVPVPAIPRRTTVGPQEANPSAGQLEHEAQLARRQAELRIALGAAAGIANVEQRTEALTRLCFQWAEFDPRGAVDLAFDYHLDEAREGVIENLTQQWAAVDIAATRAWVEAQPSGAARAELAARVGFVWSRADPEAAANFVIANTSAGPIQTEAAISVLYQWARHDPEAALEWARRFPPGALRDRAIKEALAAAPRDEN